MRAFGRCLTIGLLVGIGQQAHPQVRQTAKTADKLIDFFRGAKAGERAETQRLIKEWSRASDEAMRIRVAERMAAERAAAEGSRRPYPPVFFSETKSARTKAIKTLNTFKGLETVKLTEAQQITRHRAFWRWNYPIHTAKLNQLDVYLSIPGNTEEFKHIFHQSNNRQLKEIKSIRQVLIDRPDKDLNFPNSAEDFLSSISNSAETKPIVLVGHNQNGELRFSDGSSSSFAKMDSTATAVGRVIVFLSCNAQDHTQSPAVKHYLSYIEALVLVEKLNGYSYAGKEKGQVKIALQNILNAYAKKKYLDIRLKVLAFGTATAAGGYGMYVIDKRHQKRSLNPKAKV